MNDAFILGAGFSIAVAPLAMPDMESLGTEAVELLKVAHNRIDAVHSDTCDGLSCDRPILMNGKVPASSFEAWLTKLATLQPYLLDPDNDRNAALYKELTGLVAMIIERAMDIVTDGQDPPSWLPKLVRCWHEREVNVLSFNYDMLIESTVDLLSLPFPGYEESTTRISAYNLPPAIVPFWSPFFGSGTMPPLVPSFRFLKLHGSLGWYWDERTRSAESMVDVGSRWVWLKGQIEESQRPRTPGKVPVIVPPTAGKNPFLENASLRFLWREAFAALRASDRIFILGYSLPPEDLLVRSMLIDAYSAKPKPVWVINPDPDMLERFDEIGGIEMVKDFCGVDDPIPQFVEWYETTPEREES